jgi:5'-nucleotidase
MEEFTGNLSRRKFVGNLTAMLALTGSGLLSTEILDARQLRKLTILHTNDTHSRIDPFPDNDPKFPGMGGVARRLATIHKIRSEERNVLLFDSGDIFQGTPYFNFYGGELEIKLMSKMGYDAATMGNHDFDNGIEGFIKQLPHANFPFLTANYNFKDTLLNGKTLSYTLFEKQDVKIGVFGIGIELKGLVDDKCYGKTIHNNPLEIANQTADFLRKEKKCDLVICLSHLGYKYENNLKPSDEMLATQSRNIDLILGGHTHTFLDTPVAFKNILGNEVLVAQTGWGGIRLGRIDYFIEKKSRRISKKSSTVKISKYSS